MDGKILIVDDNEDVLFALNLLLEPYVEKIKDTTSPARIEYFILLDMNFSRDASSGQEGFLWLEKILQKDPQAVVLFITAYADTEKAVKAIRAGAIDFIPKPWETEKLLATISSAIRLRQTRTEVVALKEQLTALSAPDEGVEIIGESPAILEVIHTIKKISGTDANILLLGENGTGKDLIARAIYRNPDYLFFDEATNALDTDNEKTIQRNLDQFFKDRTVVIVAHRLSTVRNADQIVVLKDGNITEQGNHDSLISQQGDYYRLVKNQLELNA